MIRILEPRLAFSSWKPWIYRETTKRESLDDPPMDFDVPGVYLFAMFKNKKEMKDKSNEFRYLNPHVIYIGQSTRITHRLEAHEKIRKDYISKYSDFECKYLYHSISHPEWHPLGANNRDIEKVRKAWLHYVERKLIWEYGKQYNHIPEFNKY